MPGDVLAGVLLAAGAGTRFGADKLAAQLDGVTLLDRSVAAMLDAGLNPVIVVVAPGFNRPLPDKARAVVNEHAHSGMASSVRSGLAALRTAPEVLACVIAPADQPWCGTAVYRRLIEAYRRSGAPLIVAAFDGALRNPVLLARDQWSLSERIEGDVGLSSVVRGRSPQAVECGDIGSIADVDTPADLLRDRLQR